MGEEQTQDFPVGVQGDSQAHSRPDVVRHPCHQRPTSQQACGSGQPPGTCDKQSNGPARDTRMRSYPLVVPKAWQ